MAFLEKLRWSFGVILLLAAACSPVPTATPVMTATAPLVTATVALTATPAATQTSAPTETAQPSATPADTATAAPSPTSAPDYAALQVRGLSNRPGGWMLTFTLPGAVPVNLLLGGVEYTCDVEPAYPDRLFCQGLARPAYDQDLTLLIKDAQDGHALYQGVLVVPAAMVLPPTPAGWSQTSCDQRGQNVRCETECRIAPNGNPCIVATCTDACGPYFSVHTCPEMSLDFSSCSAEQWAYMKRLYQIP